MWAGSRIEFVAPIPIGAAIERRTTIASIDSKQGRLGEMLFVALDHEIMCDDVIAICERQDIVYRGEQVAGTSPVPTERREATRSRMHHPTTVELFRYSALTRNGHRIHYERDYARDVEGYPALIVQGPLAATLLLDFFRSADPENTVSRFGFRARAPLFDDAPFFPVHDRRRVMDRDAGWRAGDNRGSQRSIVSEPREQLGKVQAQRLVTRHDLRRDR